MDIVGVKEVIQVSGKGLGKVSALGKFRQLLGMQPGQPSCVPRSGRSSSRPQHSGTCFRNCWLPWAQ